MKNPFEVIQTALVTEKATDLKDNKQYIFKVSKDANKLDIKKAVEKLYDVKVKSVNIINTKGKVKRAGRMLKKGKRPDIKKAIVTLSQGEIKFF